MAKMIDDFKLNQEILGRKKSYISTCMYRLNIWKTFMEDGLGITQVEDVDKQYIISINDYQLNKKDDELMHLITKHTKIELDENDKLLKFDF